MLFKPIINAIKPIPKNIGNATCRIQGQSYLDDWPYRSGETTLEEQMFYCFILMANNIFLTTMPIHFARLSWWEWLLCEGTIQIPLSLRGSSVSQACYFLLIVTSGWISTLYREATKNLTFLWRFQWNSSYPICRWTFAKHRSKAFQATSLWPDKSLLIVTFAQEFFITIAIVSLLWQTILYNVGYCLQRVVLPRCLSP
jgi:uncharacterized membrane protein YfbV (UPF0208 family)